LISGGLFSSVRISIAIGVVLILSIAWALRRGLWRRSPTTCAWIAFILVSAAVITAGRAGFGVFHASRYAIYGSALLTLALLAVATVTAPWRRGANVALVVACACVSALVSWESLPAAAGYTFRARLLAKARPQAPDVVTDPYFGVLYPAPPSAYQVLDAAERRGVWRAREEPVYPTEVRFVDGVEASTLQAGRVDAIERSGNTLRVVGWSHLPATLRGRVIWVSGDAAPAASRVKVAGRLDVAMATGVPALVFSGFELSLDYASEEAARGAASSLCVLAEAPQHGVRMLSNGPGCPEASPTG
jgi:hypothetical protein